MTTHAEATESMVEAIDRLEALRNDYMHRVGADRLPVVRTDLLNGVGMVVTYGSTSTYAIESRATGDGRFVHRINGEWYPSASGIPSTYRKAKAIAQGVESVDASELLEAQQAYEDASHAYREAN